MTNLHQAYSPTFTECLHRYNNAHYFVSLWTKRLLTYAIVGAFALGIAIPTFHSFLFIQNNIYSKCCCIAFVIAICVFAHCGAYLIAARKYFKGLKRKEFEAHVVLDELCSIDLIKDPPYASLF